MQLFYKQLAKARERQLIRNMSASGVKRQLYRTASALGLMIGLHTGAMMGLEGMNLGDAFWLTMTTVATVGYGDLSAHTMLGRAATISLGFLGGVALLAQTASLYFEARQIKRDKVLNGKWKWNMDNHIVIINSPKNNAEGYFKKLISEFRVSDLEGSQTPMVVVCPDMTTGMPEDVRKYNVAHVNEPITSKEAFDKSNVAEAKTIVILAKDPEDALSDSITFDLVSRVREANPTATIIAEATTDENRKRLKALGADQVMRPMRTYPEMMVRSILAPGAETVIEDLFDSRGEEVTRYNVSLKGTWADVASRLITSDIGLPLAYVSNDGEVVSNARPDAEVDGKAVLVVVREGNTKTDKEVQGLLNRTAQVSFSTAAAAQPANTNLADAAVAAVAEAATKRKGLFAGLGLGKRG